MTQADKALRWARILHAAFLLAAIVYVLLPVALIKSQTRQVDALFVGGMAAVSFSVFAAAVLFRRRMVAPSAESLRRNPEDASAAESWRRGIILSLVFCETIVLLGLVLRLLGTTWDICGVFFAVGILVLLAWTPKLDVGPGN